MDGHSPQQASSKKDAILRSSRELALKWVNVHFSQYLDHLQQRLFKMAEQADNNADQHRYFQARDEISGNQKLINQRFLKHIHQAFDQFRKRQDTATDYSTDFSMQEQFTLDDASTLSLVDNTELEGRLAIGAMSRKVATENSDLLYALNQRWSALSGGRKIIDRQNPVAPAVFGESVQLAIADLQLDEKGRLLSLKVFDQQFMSKIKKLYELLNHHLVKHDILPNLRYSVKKEQDRYAKQQTEQISKASMAHQIDLITSIRAIQASLAAQARAHTQAQTRTHNTGPTAPVLPSEHLITEIQQLQRNSGDMLQALGSQPSAIHNAPVHIHQQAEKEIQQSSEEVGTQAIEIVGLLFEYMLNDQQLPDSVKALLSYLHTPLLKLAVMDKDFFDHPEHPARQLLNSLVAAGERWVEPSGKQKSDVFQKIKAVVQRVLDEFDNDVRLFSELAFEFNHYLRQHARRIQLAEKRARQAAEGENKLKEIRLKIRTYLERKTANIDLTPGVKTLLFEPWASFLSFNLLRYGSSSQQWREAANIADDILWFLLPHDPNHLPTVKRLQELKAALPDKLQEGFDTVGYDSNQGKKLLNALYEQQQTLPVATEPAPTPVKTHIDDVDLAQQINTTVEADELLQQLKQTEFGTWFEFDADNNKPRRVKLAWANSNTLHFMFVNRLGQQVAVKTGEELAAEIREGKTRVSGNKENKPFFEKAMEKILEQLRQRKPNEES